MRHPSKVMDEFTAEIKVVGQNHKPWFFTLEAMIDTGAKRSSIDTKLAELLALEEVGEIKVSNAMGKQARPVVKIKLFHNGEPYELEVSITDRSQLSYPMILGRDFLSLWKSMPTEDQ